MATAKLAPPAPEQQRYAEQFAITRATERGPENRDELEPKHVQSGPFSAEPVARPAGGNAEYRPAQKRQRNQDALLDRGQM